MKIDRLISIIMILLNKKRISAQELADMFEVSPRTIYRDIDAIAMAGIPVRSTSGAGGGFEIMQNYKVDKNVFSSDDLSALLMGLSNLSGMIQSNELINTLAKVKSFIPADQAKDIELKANQISIDLSPWLDNRNTQPYLEIIKTGIQENRVLTFEYADRYGNKTTRTAEPYQLVLKGSHWYWQGYCRRREDFRLFRLSRMSNLQLGADFFIPREYEKRPLEYNDVLAAMHTKIIIRIHKSILTRVREYCADEYFLPDGTDHYTVSFPFIENDYYYSILLGFGDKCECIQPEHVRTEIKRRIHNLAKIYKN